MPDRPANPIRPYWPSIAPATKELVVTIAIGIIAIAIGGLLFAGQVVSVTNLELAQRLGLQESPERTDPLFGRLEVWTARWDVLTLWVLPLAGLLMILDHSWWPYLAMIGGGIGADTGGREIVKYLGLKEQGVRLGETSEQRLLFGAMAVLAIVGVLIAVYGLVEVV